MMHPTSTTYTFITSGSDNGKQYRAQLSNGCGIVTSTTALLTVNTLPSCSIGGANGVCANSLNNVFSGPAGMTAYRWALSGSGTLSGATNAQSVSVNAAASGSFTLTRPSPWSSLLLVTMPMTTAVPAPWP